jgi:hypothetical protein
MDDKFALKMDSHTSDTALVTSDNDTDNSVKLPRNSKENRYYYTHREEILEKRREKRMQTPEYIAKLEEKERIKAQKMAEKELLRAEKEEKKRGRAEMLLKLLKSPGDVKRA